MCAFPSHTPFIIIIFIKIYWTKVNIWILFWVASRHLERFSFEARPKLKRRWIFAYFFFKEFIPDGLLTDSIERVPEFFEVRFRQRRNFTKEINQGKISYENSWTNYQNEFVSKLKFIREIFELFSRHGNILWQKQTFLFLSKVNKVPEENEKLIINTHSTIKINNVRCKYGYMSLTLFSLMCELKI